MKTHHRNPNEILRMAAIIYLGDPVLLENLLSKSKDYPKKQVDQTKEKSVPSR
jgi:hypothetical protein